MLVESFAPDRATAGTYSKVVFLRDCFPFVASCFVCLRTRLGSAWLSIFGEVMLETPVLRSEAGLNNSVAA